MSATPSLGPAKTAAGPVHESAGEQEAGRRAGRELGQRRARVVNIAAQAGVAVAFYLVYAQVRDWHRSASEHNVQAAQGHGLAVLHLERVLHLDIELRVQHALMSWTAVVRAMNVFYGSFHFAATCAIYVGLLVCSPGSVFRRARDILAITTAIALAFFALYPTMPPRLLPASYGYQDTMVTIGGLWSYNHGVVEHISDPFAAMPSLHIAWATWCSLALWPVWRRKSVRVALIVYPVVTALTVIVTGTHWLLDLIAGEAVLVAAWAVVTGVRRRASPRLGDVRVGEGDQ